MTFCSTHCGKPTDCWGNSGDGGNAKEAVVKDCGAVYMYFQVPPESILLPITTHLVHFLNKRQPKLQARDAGIWWGTLGKLQLMLRKAAKVGGEIGIY